MKRAIVAVTNDLTTDQRVDRTCKTLLKAGYLPLLVGRRMKNSRTTSPRPYQTQRLRLLFEKGPWFYAEYNIRLFFFLLFRPCDLVVSNDLDTLPAVYLAKTIKRFFGPRRAPIHIHDCHEYFRGVPELSGRKTVTATWKWIEDRIFPNLQIVLAVNQSVAELYTKEYGIRISILRNVPFRKGLEGARNKQSMKIAAQQKIILYQGAVNIDRGLEEAIQAMGYIKTDAILVIAGIGDIYQSLVDYTSRQGLSEKVRFLGQVSFEQLHSVTLMADLGLSIEKDVSINYHFCLPNKFLDYIQANVPVLVSPFPEMKKIVDEYQIGEFIENHDPVYLALVFDRILNDRPGLELYRKNLKKAAAELCWENEENQLRSLLK